MSTPPSLEPSCRATGGDAAQEAGTIVALGPDLAPEVGEPPTSGVTLVADIARQRPTKIWDGGWMLQNQTLNAPPLAVEEQITRRTGQVTKWGSLGCRRAYPSGRLQHLIGTR